MSTDTTDYGTPGYDATTGYDDDQSEQTNVAAEPEVTDEPAKKTTKSTRTKSTPRGKAPTTAQVRAVLDVVARVAAADDDTVATARNLTGSDDDTALTVAIATGKAKVPAAVEMIKRLRGEDRAVAQIEVGATSPAELRELWTLVSTLDASNDRLPNSAHIKIAIRAVEKVDALSDDQVARLDAVTELVNG